MDMTFLVLFFAVAFAIVAILAFRSPKNLGPNESGTERRHPADHPDDEELLARRKDDGVGGEGG
jgi:hypothetical protein